MAEILKGVRILDLGLAGRFENQLAVDPIASPPQAQVNDHGTHAPIRQLAERGVQVGHREVVDFPKCSARLRRAVAGQTASISCHPPEAHQRPRQTWRWRWCRSW